MHAPGSGCSFSEARPDRPDRLALFTPPSNIHAPLTPTHHAAQHTQRSRFQLTWLLVCTLRPPQPRSPTLSLSQAHRSAGPGPADLEFKALETDIDIVPKFKMAAIEALDGVSSYPALARPASLCAAGVFVLCGGETRRDGHRLAHHGPWARLRVR